MPYTPEKPREYRVSPRYLAGTKADAAEAITPLIEARWAATNDDLGNAYVTAPDLTPRLMFLPEGRDSTLWKISAGPEPTVPSWLVTFDDRVPTEIVQDFTTALANACTRGPDAYLGAGQPAPRRVAGRWVDPIVLRSPDQLVTRSTRPGFLSHAEEMDETKERWLFESGPPQRRWYASASSQVPAPLLEALTAAAFDPSPVHRYLRRDELARLPASALATPTAPSPLEVARVRAATARSTAMTRGPRRRARLHHLDPPAGTATGRPRRPCPLTPTNPLEDAVSDATALDHADAMIEKAWGRPIAELEKAAPRMPVEDPMLRSAMHHRSLLVVVSNSIAVHQERLHALTRPGHVPAFYDLDRITASARPTRRATPPYR
ncbi:hypothetical protein P3T27_005887 [Kitasatospora sp. MAA19]|uniref:DUF317 domain-containing protein n=1 Tax=unclassified Kitasatospora TaxID=2633591 RepID=UPI002474D87F|nr:DUF317 domain-containing protein [Kitasatospora sp. MAA19]MDH6709141.1 hypothetical protein [Kitasatospora sp. MAA19]